MKKIRNYLFIFIIFSLFFPSISFSQGATSGNGLFVASVFKKSGQSTIYVHKFMTKELIRKIEFNSGAADVDEVEFSFSGKYLYARQGNKYTVIDVMLDKVIVSIYSASQIVFLKGKDFFLVLKNGTVYQYDCLTGKVLKTYISPSGYQINEIVMSISETQFAAKAINKVIIYDISNIENKKGFIGSDVKFSSDGQFFTIFYIFNEIVRVSTYKLSNLYQERAFTNETLLRNESPAGRLYPTRSSLSYDGSYIGLYTAKGSKVEIYVYSTLTGKLIWIINNFSNISNELYPQEWTPDNTMIGYGTQLMAGEYILDRKKSTALGLRIDNFTETPDLTIDKQKDNRIISNNFHFVVIQSGNDMYVRDSRIPNMKITYSDVRFISFSEDSKYLFVEKNDAVCVIVTDQLTQAIQNNTIAKLFEFDKILSASAPEELIGVDAKPPKGFAFFYVNNTKQIVQVDTSKLHYTLRSMNINGNDVEMQVNLVDAEGNTFLGATDPSWQFLWCNLLLQNPNGTVNQINDFVVEEVYEDEPTAYALILDHSGSMGTKRANSLQYGALNMINHKSDEDSYMLIKYDNKVKLESNLSTSPTLIRRKLNNTGMTGFGGGTALIDATYTGVKYLQKSNDYQKKVIILFTDGYENASFFSKYDLLSEANAGNIEINVIGFGDRINESYLMSLAYNTGGIYVRLYDTKDLKKVFRDIDFRRRHYYKIKFKTQVKGKHLAFLQLCQDQFKHDSLWVPFDNSGQNDRIDDRNPVLPVKPREIRLTQFNKLKIPINPVLKPVQDRKITKDFGDIHFPNILFATASDEIVNSNKDGIDEIVKFMIKYPFVFLEIHGHTDNQGTPDFNRELSIARAQAAKKLILAKGIAPGRVVTRGYGDTKPIATNDTEEGKTKNRRIEFHIFIQ